MMYCTSCNGILLLDRDRVREPCDAESAVDLVTLNLTRGGHFVWEVYHADFET
jgi:hypothetical protein